MQHLSTPLDSDIRIVVDTHTDHNTIDMLRKDTPIPSSYWKIISRTFGTSFEINVRN